jgi:hypothetical protein
VGDLGEEGSHGYHHSSSLSGPLLWHRFHLVTVFFWVSHLVLK